MISINVTKLKLRAWRFVAGWAHMLQVRLPHASETRTLRILVVRTSYVSLLKFHHKKMYWFSYDSLMECISYDNLMKYFQFVKKSVTRVRTMDIVIWRRAFTPHAHRRFEKLFCWIPNKKLELIEKGSHDFHSLIRMKHSHNFGRMKILRPVSSVYASFYVWGLLSWVALNRPWPSCRRNWSKSPRYGTRPHYFLYKNTSFRFNCVIP